MLYLTPAWAAKCITIDGLKFKKTLFNFFSSIKSIFLKVKFLKLLIFLIFAFLNLCHNNY